MKNDMEKVSAKVAYLVNQYPKISHTFIRREILALEAQGTSVVRISVRETQEQLSDSIDREEKKITHYILGQSKVKTAWNLIKAFLLCLPKLLPALRSTVFLCKRSCALLRPIIYLFEACSLYQFCKKQNIGHIHVHFGTNSTTVAMLCRKLGGPTYSMTIHGPEEFDSPKAIALDKKIRHAKFVVAISSYCRSQLFRWAQSSDWPKIAEVHCVVNTEFLVSDNESAIEPKRFLSVGRLCEQKGQMLLLAAFHKVYLRHPDAQLHLIGDGEFREPIEKFIQEHGLQNNVYLHGWRDSNYIAEQLDKCSAMVLPSFAEGLPVVIMEAFARCRPVISTYIAGIPELVTPDCGWLVPAGHIEKLSEAMEEALSMSPSQLYAMGNRGLNKINQAHNPAIEAKKLSSLFDG